MRNPPPPPATERCFGDVQTRYVDAEFIGGCDIVMQMLGLGLALESSRSLRDQAGIGLGLRA